jgi:hypothetical protein
MHFILMAVVFLSRWASYPKGREKEVWGGFVNIDKNAIIFVFVSYLRDRYYVDKFVACR